LIRLIQYYYKLGISSRVQQKVSMIVVRIRSDVFSIPINYAARRATLKRRLPVSNIACTVSITIKFASSYEQLPPDTIVIIRSPMTLPDSNAKNAVE
jgi:hypothetical protein